MTADASENKVVAVTIHTSREIRNLKGYVVGKLVENVDYSSEHIEETTITERLVKALRKEDKELFETWKANIAMAFVDEFNRIPNRSHSVTADVHRVGNKAAKNFLNTLCMETQDEEDERLEDQVERLEEQNNILKKALDIEGIGGYSHDMSSQDMLRRLIDKKSEIFPENTELDRRENKIKQLQAENAMLKTVAEELKEDIVEIKGIMEQAKGLL